MAHDQLWFSTRKGLFQAHAGPGGWSIRRVHFLGDPVTCLMKDGRDGTLYAALNLGHFGVKLRRSTDAGDSWQDVGVPAYPEKPVDPDDANPWKLQLIWSLVAGGVDQPGLLWAGTVPGGLFVSRDRGDTWQLVRALWDRPERRKWFGGGYDQPGIHSILVDPRDSRRISIGISCAGVWHSADGGDSWVLSAKGMRAAFMPPEQAFEEGIQDPHLLAACAAAPDNVWCQHHNGIFVSVDGGRAWRECGEVQPSAFGFAVAAHPTDPATAWFVPAVKDETRVPVAGRLVVTRTRDGGRTFESLGQGLPEANCYDLIYRHGLAVDAEGRQLAMGSTTGGAWTSADGGDSWRALPARLPPVNAVCFG